MPGSKKHSKRGKKRRGQKPILDDLKSRCRISRIFIPIDAAHDPGTMAYQKVYEGFEDGSIPSENLHEPSIHSNIQKGDEMTVNDKTKKATKKASAKATAKKVTPAPSTSTKAEFEFLAETGKDGAEIYQAIDEMVEKDLKDQKPKAAKKAPAKKTAKKEAAPKAAKAEPAEPKSSAKKAPKAKPAAKEPVAPDPGTNKADEFDFLAQTGKDGAEIYQTVEEMAEKDLAKKPVKKTPEKPVEKPAEPVKEAKAEAPAKETVPAPGIDIAAELAFIEGTTKYGGIIYQDISDLYESSKNQGCPIGKSGSPECSAEVPAETKPAEKAEPAKEEAKPAESKKEEPAKPETEKAVAPVPGADKADEFDFLEQTGKDGAEIYQAIDNMVEKDLSEKPAETKPEEKEPAVKTTKTEGKFTDLNNRPALKPVNLTEEALRTYQTFSNDTLLEMAAALGLEKDLDTLTKDIVAAASLEKYTEDLALDVLMKYKDYSFEEDGFDVALLPVLVKRIADTLPFKASDLTDLGDQIKEDVKMYLTDDGMANADLYHRLFDHVRSILIRGQQQGARTLEELQLGEDVDVKALIEHFMNVAYDLLPYWQYDDVKYYEGFIFAVLSQFADLADLQNKAMMDIADLYIKHGDYGRGDADYNYLLRENNLKDQIYYRFANVYRPIDLQKAKNIAGSALQFVDGRYDYYPRLIEILESY